MWRVMSAAHRVRFKQWRSERERLQVSVSSGRSARHAARDGRAGQPAVDRARRDTTIPSSSSSSPGRPRLHRASVHPQVLPPGLLRQRQLLLTRARARRKLNYSHVARHSAFVFVNSVVFRRTLYTQVIGCNVQGWPKKLGHHISRLASS